MPALRLLRWQGTMVPTARANVHHWGRVCAACTGGPFSFKPLHTLIAAVLEECVGVRGAFAD